MKNIFSTFFWIILPIFLFISFRSNEFPDKVIWSDMEGYYVYLPSVVIYDGFVKEAVKDTGYIKVWPGTDKVFTKYTCGVAIMESPFFMMAHLLSNATGYASDGHSLIYCYALMVSGAFYLVLGCFFLWLYLGKHFSFAVTASTLLCLVLGTNLFYYSVFQPTMSHVYSFCLFAALIWLSRLLFEEHSHKKLHYFLFGLVAGLIVLIRPTGAVVLLLPLYQLVKQSNLNEFIKKNLTSFMVALFAVVITWIPQLLYWKHVTGEWFLWSYQNETFKYWAEPKVIKVLFGAWNGWLLYSPIAIFALVGLFTGYKSNMHHEKITTLILLISTYLFASWWAWWFGGAFGHRCYVEFYAVLATPFATVCAKAFEKKWTAVPFLFICLILVYYNIGLTYNYVPPWDGPNWNYESVWAEVRKLF